eukprot:Rhum_TRINITY_DN9102_c0_g1::Rhum_TRINITY_DN9102_c0_g1_i1::g.31559::m.31559
MPHEPFSEQSVPFGDDSPTKAVKVQKKKRFPFFRASQRPSNAAPADTPYGGEDEAAPAFKQPVEVTQSVEATQSQKAAHPDFCESSSSDSDGSGGGTRAAPAPPAAPAADFCDSSSDEEATFSAVSAPAPQRRSVPPPQPSQQTRSKSAASTDARLDLAASATLLPPPPSELADDLQTVGDDEDDDADAAIIPLHQLAHCVDVVAEAAHFAAAKGRPDLSNALMEVVVMLEGSGGGDVAPVLRQGFRLGQFVEVRYMLDDEVLWDRCTVAEGSGGGTYSVEFDSGEIWDNIPREDLRPVSSLVKDEQAVVWDLTTKDERVMYSGWFYTQESYFQGKGIMWGMIIGTRFYKGREPDSANWAVKQLQGCSVEKTGDYTITVHHRKPENRFTMQFEGNSYEMQVWLVQLKTAVCRAERRPDATRIVELENELDGVVRRPVLPLFNPQVAVEVSHIATLSAYVVCSCGRAWFSSHDWKRRWVVLHQAWMCVRPDKASPDDNLVLPLREVELRDAPTEEHPHVFEIVGPFVGSKLFYFDDAEMFTKWKRAVQYAILVSNPEAKLNLLEEAQTDERGLA